MYELRGQSIERQRVGQRRSALAYYFDLLESSTDGCDPVAVGAAFKEDLRALGRLDDSVKEPPRVLEYAGLIYWPEPRDLSLPDGSLIHLNPQHGRIFHALILNPEVVLSHSRLLQRIGHEADSLSLDLLRVHIRTIRNLIGDTPQEDGHRKYIQTILDTGYMLKSPRALQTFL